MERFAWVLPSLDLSQVWLSGPVQGKYKIILCRFGKHFHHFSSIHTEIKYAAEKNDSVGITIILILYADAQPEINLESSQHILWQ